MVAVLRIQLWAGICLPCSSGGYVSNDNGFTTKDLILALFSSAYSPLVQVQNPSPIL